MRFFNRLAVVAAGHSWAWQIHAQSHATSSAICIQDKWTFNNQGFSPCLVASALDGECHGGRWDIPPLQPNSAYGGPFQGQSDKCQCSSVVFSMISACGTCQGGSIASWSDWIKNCSQSDISVSSFPVSIPLGLTVPAWAYLNVTTKGVWDPTDALATHNSGASDSSAISGTATATATGTGIVATSTASSNSSTNAGAIAGGVVGGVVGLSIVALGAFFLMRRRKRAPASAQFTGMEQADLTGHSPAFGRFHTPPPAMLIEPPRLYDPSDPSTFPASPPPSLPGHMLSASPAPSAPHSQISLPYSGISGPISPTTTSGYGHVHQASQSSHGYSGVPEV